MVEELEIIDDDEVVEKTASAEPEVIEVTDAAIPLPPRMHQADEDCEEKVVEIALTTDEDEEVAPKPKKAKGETAEVAVAPQAEDAEPAPKAEVKDDEEGETLEIITNDSEVDELENAAFVTDEDEAREAVINEINEIADSADRSLNVKVPFIDARISKNNVIGKFLSLNKHLLNKKYHSVVDSGKSEVYSPLLNDMLNNVKANIKAMSEARATKARSRGIGFVDTGKGYFADASF